MWYWTGICRSYFAGIVRLVGTLLVLAYLNIPIVTITFLIYTIGFFVTHVFNKKSIQYTKLKKDLGNKMNFLPLPVLRLEHMTKTEKQM